MVPPRQLVACWKRPMTRGVARAARGQLQLRCPVFQTDSRTTWRAKVRGIMQSSKYSRLVVAVRVAAAAAATVAAARAWRGPAVTRYLHTLRASTPQGGAEGRTKVM